MQDGYLLFVRDPRTRTYITDGAVYATEIDALLALGPRTGYARPRHAWLTVRGTNLYVRRGDEWYKP